MIRAILCLAGLALAWPVSAQVFPTLGRETPRLQTVKWKDGQRIILTALPETALTVMLERGETYPEFLGTDGDADVFQAESVRQLPPVSDDTP